MTMFTNVGVIKMFQNNFVYLNVDSLFKTISIFL